MLTVIWMAVMHFLFVHNIDAFFDGAQFMFIVLLWRALNIGGIICDWSICLWLHAVSVIAYLKAWYQRRCCPAGAATGPSLCLTSTNITAVTSPHEIAQSWYEPDLDCSSSLGHWCFSSLLAIVVVDFWCLLTNCSYCQNTVAFMQFCRCCRCCLWPLCIGSCWWISLRFFCCRFCKCIFLQFAGT